jgi:RNA polymerase sigma factor (sigma-70 family)
LLGARCAHAGAERARLAEANFRGRSGNCDHIHHGPRGCTDDGTCDEGRSRGVFNEAFRDQDLLDAIQQALERSRKAREQQAATKELRQRFALLTPREREVMERVVAGLLNKQIGAELGTSETTVKIHRHQVIEKMGAGSLPELVRMADRLGIIVRKS